MLFVQFHAFSFEKFRVFAFLSDFFGAVFQSRSFWHLKMASKTNHLRMDEIIEKLEAKSDEDTETIDEEETISSVEEDINEDHVNNGSSCAIDACYRDSVLNYDRDFIDVSIILLIMERNLQIFCSKEIPNKFTDITCLEFSLLFLHYSMAYLCKNIENYSTCIVNKV